MIFRHSSFIFFPSHVLSWENGMIGLKLVPWLLVTVRGDPQADPTLKGMLAKIQSGEFENNFFDGEVLESTPGSEKEATAGCLLDKVGAIVEERPGLNMC